MNKGIRFTDGFKQDAVAQVAKSPRARSEVAEQAAEIKRLKRELARVTEERTILKKATAYFARESQ
jgi:transposase